jgi:AraC family transcriptional regulator
MASDEMLEQAGIAVRKHLRTQQLDLFDLHNDRPSSLGWHTHDKPHFAFLLRGEMSWSTRGRRHECAPWVGTYHPAGVEHRVDLSAGTHCFTLTLGERWLDRLSEHAPPPRAPVTLEGPTRWAAMRLFAEFWELRPCSLLVIEGLTAELLGAAARAAGSADHQPPPWLRDLQSRLEADFAKPLRLTELAVAMGVHPGRLSRSFRHFTGQTVGDYVRELRVRFLLRELGRFEKPLAMVAAEAGYCDQSHCAREFRRVTGFTPAAYRRRLREGTAGRSISD